METYDWVLVGGAVATALGVLTLVSALMDRGSIRLFFFFFAVAAGFYFIADQVREEGMSFNDVIPAVGKAVEYGRDLAGQPSE